MGINSYLLSGTRRLINSRPSCPKSLFYHDGCYQGIRAAKAFDSENTREMISNITITEKNETCQTAETPGAQGAFSDKVAPDTDIFTDEPVIQRDVQVVKNTFIDGSK